MSGHTVKRLADSTDVRAEHGLPGEMHMLGRELETEQVSLTHRRMPPDTGEKGMFGHTHKTQEEVYFVASGKLTFKLEDELVEVGPGAAIRLSPDVKRSYHNEGGEDVELLIVSTKVDDLRSETELDQEFWAAS
jgi:mannose-6-phosphate isomerase-like protein (cupin superfamily)